VAPLTFDKKLGVVAWAARPSRRPELQKKVSASDEGLIMSDSVLLQTRQGGVLTLTLNRPEKLNAFNDALVHALIDGLQAAATDSSVRAIVIRGAGRGFSAGQDLEVFVERRNSPNKLSVAEHLRDTYNKLVTIIREIDKPVIASLNGIAAGVGLSVALACDLRIAADNSVLTLGFSKIGLIPDGGASLMLPALIGLGRGLELAWSSDRIDAAEAHRLGLVNTVVPAAELEERTLAYAERFASVSPVAVGLTKRAFNASVLPNFTAWLEAEATFQEEAAAGPDLMEGVTAFLQKRAPAFAAR
jgi:2-(1,2-epoxy-1,2-dihydrophenyl)acetyl-CoA isomerase